MTDVVSEHMSNSLTLGFEGYPSLVFFPHDNRVGSKVRKAMINPVDHLETEQARQWVEVGMLESESKRVFVAWK